MLETLTWFTNLVYTERCIGVRDFAKLRTTWETAHSWSSACTTFAKSWGTIAESSPQARSLMDAPLDLLYLSIFLKLNMHTAHGSSKLSSMVLKRTKSLVVWRASESKEVESS